MAYSFTHLAFFTTLAPLKPIHRPRLHPLLHSKPSHLSRGQKSATVVAYKVTIEHKETTRTLEVGPDETILGRALEEGIAVPHDCKLGVCMTWPARLLSGDVDQSDGMLSDDVVERGYALLCASYPRSDCAIRTIPEDELLSLSPPPPTTKLVV